MAFILVIQYWFQCAWLYAMCEWFYVFVCFVRRAHAFTHSTSTLRKFSTMKILNAVVCSCLQYSHHFSLSRCNAISTTFYSDCPCFAHEPSEKLLKSLYSYHHLYQNLQLIFSYQFILSLFLIIQAKSIYRFLFHFANELWNVQISFVFKNVEKFYSKFTKIYFF